MEKGTLLVTSPAFEHEAEIPVKYSCEGDGINPPLTISNIPPSALSLAIIAEDPDAPGGTFDHWLMWDIPVTSSIIMENSNPGVLGNHGSNETGYYPPCPPSGSHRYYFHVYAINRMLELPEGSSRQDFEAAIKDGVIAEGSLMGTYEKKNAENK